MSFAAVQHAPIGALTLDDKRIADVNAALMDLTGLPTTALVGAGFSDIFSPLMDTVDDFGQVVSGTQRHAVFVRSLACGPHQGRRVRVTLWNTPSTLALIEPLGAHEEAAAVLTEFAAVIAHEVRNPLAGIGSALEVIKDRLPERGAEREVIAEIRGRLNRLNDQVDDLMLLVRPVDLRKSECDLSSVIDAAHARVGLPRPGLRPSTMLYCDPGLLTKALVALLRHAKDDALAPSIEWSVTDDEVTLRLSGGRLAKMKIAPGDTWSSQSRQDGLELPVARRIAEAHEGRLRATSGTSVALLLVLPRPQRRRR